MTFASVFRGAVGAAALTAAFSAHAILPPVDPVAGYGGQVFNFDCISATGCSPNIGGQLYMQVLRDIDPSDGTDPLTYFKFFNITGVPSSVALVSIEGMSGSSILNNGTNGTDFSVAAPGGNPKNLPAGNLIGFVEAQTFEADPPPTTNGINTASDIFEFSNSISYANAIAGIGDGSIRFGLHVISIAPPGTTNGFSATYVNQVPEPSTYALMAVGLAGVGVWARKRGSKA